MAFTTLTDEEEKELNRLSRFYWQEALRCEKAQAYLAGSVMLGSCIGDSADSDDQLLFGRGRPDGKGSN